MIKEISSVNNQYVKDLLSLKDKNTRNELKLFLVEGYHLVEEALKHHLLDSVLSTDKEVLNNIDIANKYLVSDAVIKKLSTTKTPQNIIGVVKNNINTSFDTLLSKRDLKLIILDNVNDPGNLGTIIRTAAALGIDAVISSVETVDYYNDKVLRATQGAIFKIPLFKMNLKEVLLLLKDNNITVYGTHLESSISVKEVDKKDKLAVVVGNEAQGVSKEVLDLCDKNIILPMNNDVESLNVSIAAALLMWELK
jgi:TrmH family RNA methyltransferase